MKINTLVEKLLQNTWIKLIGYVFTIIGGGGGVGWFFGWLWSKIDPNKNIPVIRNFIILGVIFFFILWVFWHFRKKIKNRLEWIKKMIIVMRRLEDYTKALDEKPKLIDQINVLSNKIEEMKKPQKTAFDRLPTIEKWMLVTIYNLKRNQKYECNLENFVKYFNQENFAELPKNIEENDMLYHINQLLQHDYIQENYTGSAGYGSGTRYYCLTDKGLDAVYDFKNSK
jgi:hypothetical protein